MSDELCSALSPLLSDADLTLVDVEVLQGLVRVTVDRPGGVDLDALTEANRIVSRALDDLDPLPGRYTLEVSSPGLERRLRTPEQFRAALGDTVSVRTAPGRSDQRRVQGRLAAADDAGIVVEGMEVPGGSVRVAYGDIERARTVFEWGPAPRKPKSKSRAPKQSGASKPAGREKVKTQ